MTDKSSQPDDLEDPVLPPRLAAELARIDFPAIKVPADLDAAILSRAKADYERRMRFRPFIRIASAAAAIAAIVAIVFVARVALVHPSAKLARGDVDGNGTVDMLDAYLLAKRLASGAKINSTMDVNGDGIVDQNDVDWIANSAVSLDHAGAGGKTP